MRIIHFLSGRRPEVSQATMPIGMIKALSDRGHEVCLVLSREGGDALLGLADRTGLIPSRVERLRFLRGFHPGPLWADIAAIRGLIRTWRPQVLHTYRSMEHWEAALALQGRTDIPLVRSRIITLAVSHHLFNRWLYRNRTGAVLCMSDRIREEYAGLTGGRCRAWTLWGGVDAERFHPDADGSSLRQTLGLSPEIRLIGQISTLRPRKGHEVLLEAYRRVRLEAPKTHLLVSYRDPEDSRLAALKDLAARLHVADAVTFWGRRDDLPQVMASLDIGVLASVDSEGPSRVAQEMMAVGLPVVATRTGVTPEYVRHEERGLVVDPGDPEGLARCILRLLRDPGLAERLARAGRRWVEEHASYRAMAAHIEGIYQDLLDASQTSCRPRSSVQK